jgi:hypothetical protein
MPQAITLEIAAEVVATFVSNNPLPRGELLALIQTIHDTLAEVGHTGIFDLLGGWQTFQGAETASGGARPDAGAVSREMEASLRLSHGCRQLRGDAVGDGESDWSWTVARKRRSAQTRTPAEGHSSLIRIATDPRSDRTRQRPTPTSVAVLEPRRSPREFAGIPSHGLTPRLLSLHTSAPLKREHA